MPNRDVKLGKTKPVANLQLEIEADEVIDMLRANWQARIGAVEADRILICLMLDYTPTGFLEEIAGKRNSEIGWPRLCSCGSGNVSTSLYIAETRKIIDVCGRCAKAGVL